MKFVILTNPSTNNNIVKKLLASGLRPELVVTTDPFYVKKGNFLVKVKRKIKYFNNKIVFREKYPPFFTARKNKIDVLDSSLVNTLEFGEYLRLNEIDYIFTFGFRIIKDFIITSVSKGAINFHPAYLPNNRGASPSNWVIRKGQSYTGITFHYIDKGVDTGRIIEQYKVKLSKVENTKILNLYLFQLGEQALIKLIYKIKFGLQIPSIRNVLSNGTYESIFDNKNCVIDAHSDYSEIEQIINASNEDNKKALFLFKDKWIEIINVVDITGYKENLIEELPISIEGNYVIKTKDSKLALLISNKSCYYV